MVIGECRLFDISERFQRAEMGYALRASAWGQGYAREATSALLTFGFSELEFHRIEAFVHPGNRASVRNLESLGFREEGTLRERWIIAGERADLTVYGLLDREWCQAGA